MQPIEVVTLMIQVVTTTLLIVILVIVWNLKPLRIFRLKRRARRYYIQAQARYHETLGERLHCYIFGENAALVKFNETMDELAQLDPKTPTQRL